MGTPKEIASILGNNIRKLRKDKHLTQVDIEVMTGIPASNLSLIEQGKIDIPFSKLIRIAEVLQVQLGQLYLVDLKM